MRQRNVNQLDFHYFNHVNTTGLGHDSRLVRLPKVGHYEGSPLLLLALAAVLIVIAFVL